MALPSLTSFTSYTKIKASEVNGNFTAIYNVLNGQIENANVSASAAIARSKLASGTADHVLINSGAGVMSSEASLAVTRGGTGLSTVAVGDLIYGSATATISRLTGNITTTRKFLRQVGDGAASAAPAWDTLAYGDMPFGSGSAGQVLKNVGGTPTWSSFSGGINYLSANPDAESDTSGWANYADAAGSTPVDGTGGSPTFAISRTTSSPLRGTGSFLYTKDAANRQGEGSSYAFTIDSADQGKVLTATFDYTVGSGTYATEDLTVYVYDVTNATVIQPAGYQIQSVVAGVMQKHVAVFQTASNSTSYRLCIHVASTSASAYTVKADNFYVGPQIVAYGAPVTDWVDYTPTGSWVTNVTHTGRWRRVGSVMELETLSTCSGATTSANYTISLPSGYTIDTSKLATITAETNFGVGALKDNGISQYAVTQVYYNSSTTVAIARDSGSGQNGGISNTTPFTFGSGDTVYLRFSVPILGWSSCVQMSSDTDTRVVAARITGTPAATISAGNPIIWPTVSRDTHAAYNTTTGKYTIPVSGWYVVSAACNTNVAQDNTMDAYLDGVAQQPGMQNMMNTSGIMAGTTTIYATAGQLLHVGLTGAVTGVSATPNGMSVFRISGPASIAATETVAAKYFIAGSVASSTSAPVDFATKDFDTHGAVTTGASWKFTAPVPGKYRVSMTLATASSASGVYVYKNGSQNTALCDIASTAFGSGSTLVSLVAGDYIDIRLATSLSTSGNTTQSVSIERVGN